MAAASVSHARLIIAHRLNWLEDQMEQSLFPYTRADLNPPRQRRGVDLKSRPNYSILGVDLGRK